ncbi:MAG: S41 family peptidase [Nannocystaceae bacterium]
MTARSAVGGFALGVAVTLALTASFGPGPAAAPAPRLDRSGFEQALDAVLDRYVEPVDEPALLAAGLSAMLAQLDPHSHFLTSAQRKALTKRPHAGSTGLAVALRHDAQQGPALEVLAVTPASPAARAGLAPGDRVVRIGERDVDRIATQIEAEVLLAGAVGDEVALLVQSGEGSAPREVALVLDKPRAKMVEAAIVRDDRGRSFAHVVLRHFGAESGAAVLAAIAARRRALRHELAGIILDVRGNPGGEVHEALVVADAFVATGVLVRTRGRGGRLLREEAAHSQGSDVTTPLVVLQDRRSASASELLAAALQDHKRARIVGERSYGKGTVQEVLGLPDGSVATFTVARYFSPDDRLVDGAGVTPDVAIALDPIVPVAGETDAGLRAALAAFE